MEWYVISLVAALQFDNRSVSAAKIGNNFDMSKGSALKKTE